MSPWFTPEKNCVTLNPRQWTEWISALLYCVFSQKECLYFNTTQALSVSSLLRLYNRNHIGDVKSVCWDQTVTAEDYQNPDLISDTVKSYKNRKRKFVFSQLLVIIILIIWKNWYTTVTSDFFFFASLMPFLFFIVVPFRMTKVKHGVFLSFTTHRYPYWRTQTTSDRYFTIASKHYKCWFVWVVYILGQCVASAHMVERGHE